MLSRGEVFNFYSTIPTEFCVHIFSYLPEGQCMTSGVPRNFVLGGSSTNSAEDRGQRK